MSTPPRVLSVPREPPWPARSAWAGVEVCLTAVLGSPQSIPSLTPCDTQQLAQLYPVCQRQCPGCKPTAPQPQAAGMCCPEPAPKEAELCAGWASGWRRHTGRPHVAPRTKAVCQCLDQYGGSRPTLSPGLAQEWTHPCCIERLGAGVSPCVARYMSPAWDDLWVVRGMKLVQPLPKYRGQRGCGPARWG